MELTLRKESVVVEEIKKVELVRSRRAQFIYDTNYNRIGLRGHAPIRLPVKKSVTQKEKSKGTCMEGYA